jgi:tetratricopeptide (TPR) repeat protein
MAGDLPDISKKEDIRDPRPLQELLARHQRDYGRDRPALVSETLEWIWAARRGLSETELLRLLKPAELPQLPLAIFSPLRAALQKTELLIDRSGILTFAHDSVRASVESAFVRDQDREDELRLRLADDFERQPISSRSCDELPWLLFQTESYQRLRHCLLDIDRFLEIKNRDERELRQYWVDLGEESTMGRLYLESFGRWANLAHRDGNRDESRTSFAANELGIFLVHSGLYAEAEPLLRTALEIDEKNLGADHPFIAVRLGNLASLLESMNRLEEVGGLYRRGLSISEQSFATEHPRVVWSFANLLGFLLRTNQLDEAERLLRRALASDEKCVGLERPKVANRLNTLAGLLQRTNRPAQAEPLIRRTLAILETSFGSDSADVVAALNNLALVLHQTNQLAEAESLMRRVLAIDEKTYGPEHTAVARDLNNLAGLLECTHRAPEAEPLYRRAQVIFEKNLGLDHPDVGTTLNNLAQLLKKMNRPAEAEPILLRAIQIFLKLTRNKQQLDPRLQMTVNNYGSLLEAMGRNLAQVDAALSDVAPDLYRPRNPGTP